MAPKPPPPPAKRRPGRPWVNPVGSRPRSFRVTDAEYLLLVEFLKKIRARKPQQI